MTSSTCPQCRKATLYEEYTGFDNAVIECEACGDEYKWKRYEKHKRQCSHRPVACEYCSVQFPLIDKGAHDAACLVRLEQLVRSGKRKYQELVSALEQDYETQKAHYDGKVAEMQRDFHTKTLRLRQAHARTQREFKDAKGGVDARLSHYETTYLRNDTRSSYHKVHATQMLKTHIHSGEDLVEIVLTFIPYEERLEVRAVLPKDERCDYIVGQFAFLAGDECMRCDVCVRYDEDKPIYDGRYLITNDEFIELDLLLSIVNKGA